MEASSTISALVVTYDEDISISVDTRCAVNGYITVSYDESFTTKVKIMIKKDEAQYLYTISLGTVNLPLQMGDGFYTIIVYKSTEGTKYRRLTEITMKVEGLRDEGVYSNSIQIADYEGYADVMDEIN